MHCPSLHTSKARNNWEYSSVSHVTSALSLHHVENIFAGPVYRFRFICVLVGPEISNVHSISQSHSTNMFHFFGSIYFSPYIAVLFYGCRVISVLFNTSLRKILSSASGVGSPVNPPVLQTATRHRIRNPLVRSQVDYNGLQKFKKKGRVAHWLAFLTKTGWAWHVTIHWNYMDLPHTLIFLCFPHNI